jgi:hypothetical protein
MVEKSVTAPTVSLRGFVQCGSCGVKWTGLSRAHCGACHRTFSGVTYFDRHRSVAGEHGGCLDPAGLTDSAGGPAMVLRDGLWAGPEMTDEEKQAAGFTSSRERIP